MHNILLVTNIIDRQGNTCSTQIYGRPSLVVYALSDGGEFLAMQKG